MRGFHAVLGGDFNFSANFGKKKRLEQRVVNKAVMRKERFNQKLIISRSYELVYVGLSALVCRAGALANLGHGLCTRFTLRCLAHRE